jgi:antitoxin ParD1/3/4
MNISLTPQLEQTVRDKVSSGEYNNASEVVREALRGMLRQERENALIAREAAIGYAQAEAGEVVEVGTRAGFKAIVRGSE